MKHYIIIILLTLVALIATSCKKDPVITNRYLMWPERFPKQIVNELNMFMNEAAKRNVNIELDKYVTRFVVGGKNTVAGADAAGYYDYDLKFIYIDTTSILYLQGKEFLIFHELGHGVLHRNHENGYFIDGWPISIMNESSPRLGPQDQYRRQYYVDELFNIYTPTPYWEK